MKIQSLSQYNYAKQNRIGFKSFFNIFNSKTPGQQSNCDTFERKQPTSRKAFLQLLNSTGKISKAEYQQAKEKSWGKCKIYSNVKFGKCKKYRRS